MNWCSIRLLFLLFWIISEDLALIQISIQRTCDRISLIQFVKEDFFVHSESMLTSFSLFKFFLIISTRIITDIRV